MTLDDIRNLYAYISPENPLSGGETRLQSSGWVPPVCNNPPLHPSSGGESFSCSVAAGKRAWMAPGLISQAMNSLQGLPELFTQYLKKAVATPCVGLRLIFC